MYLVCLSKIVSILQLLYDFIKKNVYEFSCDEACKYIDALKDSMYFLSLLTLYKLKKTARVIFEFFCKSSLPTPSKELYLPNGMIAAD